jgi:hypothetical protein
MFRKRRMHVEVQAFQVHVNLRRKKDRLSFLWSGNSAIHCSAQLLEPVLVKKKIKQWFA